VGWYAVLEDSRMPATSTLLDGPTGGNVRYDLTDVLFVSALW
jgi:hypothetical protein